MRIALDATPLTLPTGGLRRYVVELAAALAEAESSDEILLLSDQWFELPDRLRELRNVSVGSPVLRNKWWSVGLPLTLVKNDVDIFHGTDFTVPYIPVVPSVLTIHDLSPWKPSPIRPEGSERVRSRTPYVLPMATRVLTPTEAVRSEAIARFGLGERRVRAVPHGSTPLTAKAEIAPPGGSYIVYVGDGGPRKNLTVLLEAWRLARRELPGLGLVLVGSSGLPDEAGLARIGRADDAEMAAWLGGAVALVYPSLYEGFGLPLIEAMALGVPVIASEDPALVEVAGGCALHAPSESPERFCEAIVSVVTDGALAARLRADGIVRASEFSWRRTAHLTRDLYVEAVDAG